MMRTKKMLSEFRVHKLRILMLKRVCALLQLSGTALAVVFTLSLAMLTLCYRHCGCETEGGHKAGRAPVSFPVKVGTPVTEKAKRKGVGVTEHHGSAGAEEAKEERRYPVPQYARKRNMEGGHVELAIPDECGLWRELATDPKRLHLYDKHFTSLDVIDWFVYTSFFNESFHSGRQHGRRPRYLDIAANHAKRWSNTWFLDRCLGWEGMCAEANPKYHDELHRERHCHVVKRCLSDAERRVKFSFTDAYGGVVRGKDGFGVDGGLHAREEKFRGQFEGVEEIMCRRTGDVIREIEMEGRVEFLSLDVEGYELPILKGIDWGRVEIEVIVMENKMKVVKEFLLNKGYELYENVLKDLVFVRKASEFTVTAEMIGLMQRFNRKTRRFDGVSEW